MEKKILIIEDDENIADFLSYSLKKEGFEVEVSNSGESGINKFMSLRPDLVVLDLMLPDISGFDVCRELSDFAVPIVMLTAKSDMIDKIVGIELGADDYITKPFEVREVIARIKAIFRRIELMEKKKDVVETSAIILKGNVEIDKASREVTKNKVKVELTNKEYELLLFLAENQQRVFSRAELLDKIWGEYAMDTRTVDLHIQRIRKKLKEDKDNSVIETVFGYGYKLL